MDVEQTVGRLGGIASLEQLRARGFGRADVVEARRRGGLRKVRRGWCAVPDADADAVAAVRVRGQATCITAARALGLWTVDDGRLHVAVPGNGSRLNPRQEGAPPAHHDPTVVVHWRARTAAPTMARQPLRDVLVHVAECQPPDLALAVLDSAVRQGRCSLGWLRRVLSDSARGRELATVVDGSADAGGESIVRWRLRAARVRAIPQFRVEGLGRRDFLVGERLIVEIDGREHHALVEGFARDRWLDRELQLRGYDVLRFTYAEILHDWDRVLATIMRAVDADRHRDRSSR
ncbi:hypothetical protein C1N71_03570 [Agrococcus sp. SGAir0287]|nr:hypothetical protein C1N71_03570 [Agrococcus sp. SGAir0287]